MLRGEPQRSAPSQPWAQVGKLLPVGPGPMTTRRAEQGGERRRDPVMVGDMPTLLGGGSPKVWSLEFGWPTSTMSF